MSHAVITGTASGIGLSLARAFLAAGWQVTGLDRAGPAAADDNYSHVRLDITDEAAMEAAFAAAAARAPIDAVIGNAAVTDLAHTTIEAMDYATWQRVLRINVDGAFLTARSAARHMAGPGNIAFVTSSLAFLDQAKATDGPYCASKSAVEMLMRVLAQELKPRGINVNTLFPSVKIDTGFFAHLSEPERRELAGADLLDRPALFLATCPPGSVTGVSLDQQQWDKDADYRLSLGANA